MKKVPRFLNTPKNVFYSFSVLFVLSFLLFALQINFDHRVSIDFSIDNTFFLTLTIPLVAWFLVFFRIPWSRYVWFLLLTIGIIGSVLDLIDENRNALDLAVLGIDICMFYLFFTQPFREWIRQVKPN